MIREAAEKWIPISNNTMCRRIGDIVEDIHYPLIAQMKQRVFVQQLNEAIDGSRNAHRI